jgi:steroid delta-isomerase-like uncharacterized protein
MHIRSAEKFVYEWLDAAGHRDFDETYRLDCDAVRATRRRQAMHTTQPSGGATRVSELQTISRQRKALVRLYTDEMMSQGRVEMADEFLAYDVQFFGPGSDVPVRGCELFKEFIVGIRKAFPDLRCEVHTTIEEQDQVACWLTVHGTHQGLWRGYQPTGRHLELQAMNLFRFSGDCIIEVRAFFNVAEYDRQLGKGDGSIFKGAPSVFPG